MTILAVGAERSTPQPAARRRKQAVPRSVARPVPETFWRRRNRNARRASRAVVALTHRLAPALDVGANLRPRRILNPSEWRTSHNPGVTAVPEPAAETVVMKFGGSSVADPDKIKHVAQRLVEARERGVRVVATVSAMGDTTDGLLELAQQVSPHPHPRELDMLLSTGERIACALVAMAVHDLGYEAVSFTGSQAGIITDPVHTKAKIREITPGARGRGARPRPDRPRRRASRASRATRWT